MSGELIRLEELEVGYDGSAFLPPLSFRIDHGEQWALIGPNGSGKTTLLRSMLGLLPPISGRVVWGEETNVGYVPQRALLDTSIPARVIDLVRGGVDHGWSFLNPLYVRRREADVDQALRDTSAADLRTTQYGRLSEGQKQRVLVARALAANPELLVLDEPTAAMDLTAERDIFTLLAELRRKRNIAVMVVSHQLTVAARFATHALLVDKDRRFALCGTIREVAFNAETTSRFGALLQNELAKMEDE